MIEPDFQLSRYQTGRLIRDAMVEFCVQKGWWLVALHEEPPTFLGLSMRISELILQACKAYATLAFKGIQGRVRASAIHYELDGQGTRMESTPEMASHKIPLFHRGLVAILFT